MHATFRLPEIDKLCTRYGASGRLALPRHHKNLLGALVSSPGRAAQFPPQQIARPLVPQDHVDSNSPRVALALLLHLP